MKDFHESCATLTRACRVFGGVITNGRDEGLIKRLFDDSPEAHGHGRIFGGGIVGTHAGEIALAIEMGADTVDIGKTIHPYPTLGESIGTSLR